MLQVAVGAVEQERGVELQVNFPESTLATMLPVVMLIDVVNVLKIEFFSERLEAIVKDEVRNLKIEFFSARLEAEVNELLRALKSEVFSEKLPLGANEPPRVLKREFFSARLEVIVMELAGFRVQEVATPACSVQLIGVVLDA